MNDNKQKKETNKNRTKASPRSLAAELLYKCVKQGAYSNIVAGKLLDDESLFEDRRDRALLTALFYGASERMLALDAIIEKISSIPFKKIDIMVLCILRVGLYQLFYTDKIPQSAACNQAVESAKQYCPKSSGFVNALMRKAAREKDELIDVLSKQPEYIKYSVSESIYELLKAQYPEEYRDIFEGFFKSKSVCIRTNTIKTTAHRLAERFGGHVDEETKCAVWLSSASEAVNELDDTYFVQGKASQYAVSCLDIKNGQTVIDVCACPGGKTLSAAVELENTGKVFAFDIHSNKLPLIERSAERLGLTNIKAAQNDARAPIAELLKSADRVICDVPCSGLGSIQHKPEIRYKNAADFIKLPEIQYEILNASASYLKPGGLILYSTCTVNRAENENITNKFLNENTGFEKKCERLFLPHTDGEGFYMCVIKKCL